MDLSYLSLQEYASLPKPEANYLIDRFIPFPGRVLLVGPPKRGKSYLALQIGLAVATGSRFLGRPTIPGGRRVLYLQFDTPHVLWLERMQLLKEEGIELPTYRESADKGDFVVLAPSDVRPSLDIINNSNDTTYLIQIMSDLKPALVVVDTLAKLHAGDENDAGAMKKVFNVLNAIFADCAILYVHHTRKLSPPPGAKVLSRPSPSDAARGSSFLAGEVDAIWLLYNNCLTTEVRFDESGAYHCKQDAHTKLWEFDEAKRVEQLETQLIERWQSQAWKDWPTFRRSVTDSFPHLPDHLMLRLRRQLEPSLSMPSMPSSTDLSPSIPSSESSPTDNTQTTPPVDRPVTQPPTP